MAGARPPLICLLGPTAAGKTALAVDLARQRDCELISVDSAMVYRGLDIGTAKPDYPHHLIDIRDVAESYSAAQFAQDARRLVEAIRGRGRTPLLVGGTMLYFRAFLDGLADLPPADPRVRADIAALARRSGWPAVHEELARVDPEAAARMHPNHSQRLGRALEVYRSSGIPLSRWHAAGSAGHRDPRGTFEVVQLAIRPEPRVVLHERIEQRFQAMLAAGLVEEVARLRSRGDVSPDLPALRAVGYRQIGQYLAGECTLDEAVQRAIVATRQLAKRQLTWLRTWPDIHWIVTDGAGAVRASQSGREASSARWQTPLAAALNYLDFAAP